MDVQDVTFGGAAQSIYFDALEGRPSSITSVSVHRWDESDDATALSATTGSPSVDSVSTTFLAASGASQANPRTCTLAATANVAAGRQYLATNAQGRGEWVQVVGIISGASAIAQFPLFNDYASADPFVGTRISATLDSDWVSDAGNLSIASDPHQAYRVRWVYVVAGVTYRAYSFFRLVRQAGYHNVRPADVERLVPGFIAHLPASHRETQGRDLIDEAYLQVRNDVHQEGMDASQFRHQDLVDELVRHKTIELVWSARALSGGSIELAELAQRRYQARFDQLVRLPARAKIPADLDATGAGRTRPRPPRLTVR